MDFKINSKEFFLILRLNLNRKIHLKVIPVSTSMRKTKKKREKCHDLKKIIIYTGAPLMESHGEVIL